MEFLKSEKLELENTWPELKGCKIYLHVSILEDEGELEERHEFEVLKDDEEFWDYDTNIIDAFIKVKAEEEAAKYFNHYVYSLNSEPTSSDYHQPEFKRV